MGDSIHPPPPLSVAPSLEEVHNWLTEIGFRFDIVGTTYQNRPITMYRYDWIPHGSDYGFNTKVPVILFVSLVHGNEVMGLLSLLRVAQIVTMPSLFPQKKPVRLLLVPFVNLDAYTLNRRDGRGGGCRRTNLRPTCDAIPIDDIQNNIDCSQHMPAGGVDLNRNYPVDWDHPSGMIDEDKISAWKEFSDCIDECGLNYHGTSAWSEPESRMLRDVVLDNNVTAAISFHSRHAIYQDPLLIHPYTAQRSFEDMPANDRKRFREWSHKMNVDNFYITGTAEEAIQYTAGGSTIDWMYSVGVTSFVVEVSPPCNDRWCSSLAEEDVWQSMERYGSTGHQIIQLAVESFSDKSNPSNFNAETVQRVWLRNKPMLNLLLTMSLLCITGIIIWRRQRRKVQDIINPTEQDNNLELRIELGNVT